MHIWGRGLLLFLAEGVGPGLEGIDCLLAPNQDARLRPYLGYCVVGAGSVKPNVMHEVTTSQCLRVNVQVGGMPFCLCASLPPCLSPRS
jgi:hypothetical protein